MFGKKTKNSPTNFFVSIGAGLNQIPLILEAKNLGFHVIGVDENPVAPGFINCDLKIQESIGNYNDIYKKLSELLVDGEIRGVLTKSYGVAIKSNSFLSEKFNIPFLPFKSSDDFIHKKKMKTIFKKNNIISPESIIVNQKNKTKLKKITFPIIIKPEIGHAKIDVRKINNLEELTSFMNQEHIRSNFIYENYISGDEIIAIGIIHKKKFYLIDITDKITTPNPHFVDLMHISPSKYYSYFKKIEGIGQTVADSFSIETSPLIMEFIVTEMKEIFLIEAVPEFGGEFLPDILIPAKTGYNFIREAIKAITNIGFKPPYQKRTRGAVVVNYLTGSDGYLASCNPEGPKFIKGTLFSRIFKEIGSNVKKPVSNLDRIGVVVVKGKNVQDAMEIAEKSAGRFNVKIKENTK